MLVKVSAAALNPLDTMVRNGEFKQLLKNKPPFVLGHDVAGVVTHVGSAVRDFKVGDEVFARPRTCGSRPSRDIAIDEATSRPSRARSPSTRRPRCRWCRWPPGRPSSIAPTCSPARRSSSTPAPAAWGRPYPARQAPRRHGRDDHPRRQRRAGAQPRRGHRRRLHEGGLHQGPLRLRRRARLAGGENLERSFTVLKPGGQAIGVTGPPDPGFAKQLGAPSPCRRNALLSSKIRKQARELGVNYSFLFMQANGGQLRELASLYDAGHLRPVIDKTFPFDQTLEALRVPSSRAAPAARSSSRSTALSDSRRRETSRSPASRASASRMVCGATP